MNGYLRVVWGMMLLLILGLVATAPAYADVVREERPRDRAKVVPITVRVDPTAKESVLRIPRQFLPGADGVSLNDSPAGPGATRSVIAALAMSLAIVGGFFVRRNRRARALLVGIICLAALGMAGILLADLRPGFRPKPAPPDNAADLKLAIPPGMPGKVALYISSDGDAVTLTLAGAAAGRAAPAPRNRSAPSPTP